MSPQLSLLKKEKLAYGGELQKKSAGRTHGRPIDTRNTMHLVLRSSKAKGEWSFRRPKNARAVENIVDKFSAKYGVKILSSANVGNHLHFHVKLAKRYGYFAFIRAVTGAIAMAIKGHTRWSKHEKEKFWDYRPFTRVVESFRAYLNLRDYIRINLLEGFGVERDKARIIVMRNRGARFEGG